MKAFVTTIKEIVQKKGTDAIARVTAKVKIIFDAQRSALQLHVDTIETTVATKLNQHKDITKGTVNEIREMKIDYLNLFEKKKQSMDRLIKKKYDHFKNNKAQFITDTTLIVTGKIGKIDMVVRTIKEKTETPVEHHLMSENMKDIISENTLDSFTTICHSKSPEIVDIIGTTTKTILKDDIWLKIYVENIIAKTTAFERKNMQEMVSQIVHFSITQRIIDDYSKAACLRHATVATNDFSEVISEEDETEKEKRNRMDQQALLISGSAVVFSYFFQRASSCKIRRNDTSTLLLHDNHDTP